jgi:UDP-N-acetylmuramoyl-tripeptide--D-alanyl-D-alanine ligase
MKKTAKKFVAAILGYQVRRLLKKNDTKVIGVVGSIGKTSTKLAIAKVLEAGFKVRYQTGNYNDIVTVPLIFFGEETPSLFNPFAWAGIFWRNQRQIGRAYPYDVVVVELGSDGPGQIEEFNDYLRLEAGVITAITPEHMQFFGSLDAVAQEETAISRYSSLVLANRDLCDEKYLRELPELLTYGLKQKADFGPEMIGGIAKGKSEAEQYSLLAAAAVGSQLGLKDEAIKKGLADFQPSSGRMQELVGLNSSRIIDDSYNSSPAAAKLALDYLYEQKSPQKIAVLGNMNELGDYAKQAHQEVGSYCDPKQLELVITIGPEANEFLAPAAEAKGCSVKTFDSPYAAGEYLRLMIEKGAVVLVKGSQNKVFAEEAIKSLLANPKDAEKLVRQSPHWIKIKKAAFKV